MSALPEVPLQETLIHGHRVCYRCAGSGPLIVLVHGITSNSATWERVLPYLAERYTVLAPDLVGHGESAKPRGDYSLGAYASGVRDIMVSLGHDSATFVGHSLGGGIAMQLAYQFPERCERLVLVSSGGLGRELSVVLRAAALPGSEYVIPFLAAARLMEAGRLMSRGLERLGLKAGTDIAEVARGHASLSDRDARAAFVHTLRTMVDPGGQRVNARDRLYLAQHVPFMIIWGARDSVIPVEHAYAAHELVKGSRLEVFPDAGHFPQLDEPQRFIHLLTDFMDNTKPADMAPEEWRELLRR